MDSTSEDKVHNCVYRVIKVTRMQYDMSMIATYTSFAAIIQLFYMLSTESIDPLLLIVMLTASIFINKYTPVCEYSRKQLDKLETITLKPDYGDYFIIHCKKIKNPDPNVDRNILRNYKFHHASHEIHIKSECEFPKIFATNQ